MLFTCRTLLQLPRYHHADDIHVQTCQTVIVLAAELLYNHSPQCTSNECNCAMHIASQRVAVTSRSLPLAVRTYSVVICCPLAAVVSMGLDARPLVLALHLQSHPPVTLRPAHPARLALPYHSKGNVLTSKARGTYAGPSPDRFTSPSSWATLLASSQAYHRSVNACLIARIVCLICWRRGLVRGWPQILIA